MAVFTQGFQGPRFNKAFQFNGGDGLPFWNMPTGESWTIKEGRTAVVYGNFLLNANCSLTMEANSKLVIINGAMIADGTATQNIDPTAVILQQNLQTV